MAPLWFTNLFDPQLYYGVVTVMLILAVIVFAALHLVNAGYGIMYNSKWGPAISNRIGWVLMESPVFFAMLYIWLSSPLAGDVPLIVMTGLFLLHYFQRSFIFPCLIKGHSRMPFCIILMGATFNLVNAYLIGGWLFYISPSQYPMSWLTDPLFIGGCIIFLFGMGINLQSDRIIRNLRKPGDTRHYIPRGGFFRYVTSANYLGELTEWIGYAILTWSVGGMVFVIWTFANLAPRSRALHKRYETEFGDEYRQLNRRRLIPFIY